MTTVRRLGIASIMLVALGASIAYYATAVALRNEHGVRVSGMPWMALILIAVLAAVGVMAFWKAVQRDINTISSQMDTMARTGKIGLVMLESTGELTQIVKPLNEFLTITRRQIEELRVENRELQIQFRVAAAEKNNTEAIIFSISDAVIVTNRFDELILANEAAEKLLGFKLGGSLRKNIDQIISNGTLVRLIRETRSHGRNLTRRVVEHCIDQNGTAKTFNITLSCVAAVTDEVSGVVAVLHDVTREKEIARIKTDFVSNVSHELKTPLSSIKAYIEMLLDGEAQDEKTTKEFYEIISFETDRLHRLIENILNISRIESGVVKVVREPISLTSVVKQVLDVAIIQAKGKNIRLTETLAPVYYQIEADHDMIYQAVLNLLSNAIKYTPEGGAVGVSVSVDERRKVAVFEVSDTGAGIPPEDLPRVFDKFYRVRASEKMAKGTGLGLTLVKHIIETVHDGKLSVTSEEGKGSTFAFELPIIA